MNTRLLADLFSLDLKTDENEKGSYDTATLYTHLLSVRTFGFNNSDPAIALNRRKEAREGAESLTETTLNVVNGSPKSIVDAPKGIISKATGAVTGAVTGVASHIPIVGGLFKHKGKTANTSTGSLRWYGQNVVREIIAAGSSPEETAEICWLSAVAGVGAPIGLVSILSLPFLRKKSLN